jgi:hypothetical protein
LIAGSFISFFTFYIKESRFGNSSITTKQEKIDHKKQLSIPSTPKDSSFHFTNVETYNKQNALLSFEVNGSADDLVLHSFYSNQNGFSHTTTQPKSFGIGQHQISLNSLDKFPEEILLTSTNPAHISSPNALLIDPLKTCAAKKEPSTGTIKELKVYRQFRADFSGDSKNYEGVFLISLSSPKPKESKTDLNVWIVQGQHNQKITNNRVEITNEMNELNWIWDTNPDIHCGVAMVLATTSDCNAKMATFRLEECKN